MRAILLACSLLLPGVAQTQTAPAAPQVQTDLTQALLGDWTGVLEYRDYSEPPTSTKRVQLPTWLSIQTQPEGLRFRYIYDDGPAKTVESAPTVVIDTAAKTYKVIETDHVAESYTISGLEALKQGRGELLLSGIGKDNNKPAEIHITLTLRRNLLISLEETRPAASQEPFVFRHRYVFTRSKPPDTTKH